MKFPKTPEEKSVETAHGHRLSDDYKWLEDGDSDRVRAWSRQQNEFAEANIASPLMKQFEKELAADYNFKDQSLPYLRGDQYFWSQREPGQEQAVLYVKKGLNGKPRILIDPNESTTKSSQTTSLDYWIPSPNGTYLAYGISKNGDEISALSVLDVGTAEEIEFVAPNTGWASLCWLHDESGFYYTLYPAKGTVPKGQELMGSKILLHKLGDKPSEDKEIFGRNRAKEDRYSLSLSYDDKWLVISVAQSWSQNDLFVFDSSKDKISELIVGVDALCSISFTKDKKAIMQTNYRAANGRLLVSEADEMPGNIDDWSVLIDQRQEQIEGYLVTADKILVVYQSDASQFLLAYDYSGKKLTTLPTADFASIYEISGSLESSEFFYSYAGFVVSPTANRYNPVTGKTSLYRQSETDIDEADYEVKQEWYASKDGTKVPMFIIHQKGVAQNGKNPTLLTAYGGFNLSILPHFLRSYSPWLERGGVYAVANIRGGSEFGEKWHAGGKLAKKQNSFDDFLAAAEHLIGENYTSREHLAIIGGSNGGLLTCASLVQRPELFRAVVSLVPLADMVNFADFSIASYWIAEYGDPAKKKDFETLLKYSPYHNIDSEGKYPAVLLTTAVNDSRVDPMHARKMTALLQSTETDNPVLLWTEDDAGHAGSLTMTSFFKSHARILAFLAEQTGLNRRRPI